MKPPPTALLGRRVTKQPVTRAIRGFDPVVVADQVPFGFTDPPLPMNALGAIGLGDTMANIPPHEETRRGVRQGCDGLDLLGPSKQPSRPRQVFRPIEPMCGFE